MDATATIAQTIRVSPDVTLSTITDSSDHCSSVPSPKKEEPCLYKAIFGPSVARQLQAATSAATPKTPPRTPVSHSRRTFRLSSSSPSSRALTPSPSFRSGVSARLHHLSSLPQLGSPERARRGGPPVGTDPHNEPSQAVIEHEEEMAFSHPHQSFVVYSPKRRGTSQISVSPRRKRQRILQSPGRQEDGRPAVNTVDSRLEKPIEAPQSTLPNGNPATPLAHDLGLTPHGRRSRQSSANVLTPCRAPRLRVQHSHLYEIDAENDKQCAHESEGQGEQPLLALTPPRRKSSFADPSSITPRRAKIVATTHTDQLSARANALDGEHFRMTPGSSRWAPLPNTPVSEGDALAANVLLGFSNSPTPPQSRKSTPSALTASLERSRDAGSPNRRILAQPPAQRESARAPDQSEPCGGAKAASPNLAKCPPRTPSPTPSVNSVIPETPKTPNTSSAFAYSEFVNVSPSPQPRSRGPSGRFVNFAEGSSWDDHGDDDGDGAATTFSSQYMSPTTTGARRDSRRFSAIESVLMAGPLFPHSPALDRASGSHEDRPSERRTPTSLEQSIYTPSRRHHTSIALPLNAGFISPILKQRGKVASPILQPAISSSTSRGHSRKRSGVSFDLTSGLTSNSSSHGNNTRNLTETRSGDTTTDSSTSTPNQGLGLDMDV